MRVAVVGTGAIGASVGWHLTRRSADVLFIDGGRPGAGVSGWSFAWVNASNKTRSAEYYDLNVAGMGAHRHLAQHLSGHEWWHPTGHLRWVEDGPDTGELVASVEGLQARGYGAEVWSAARVGRVLEPSVRFPTEDTPVAFYRDEGWIDGPRLIGQLVDQAISGGAQGLFGNPVVAIEVTGHRVTAIRLAGHREAHRVDAVVNAAGPAAGAIAQLVGRTLPMLDEPGLVVRLHCATVPIHRAMHSPRVEIRPDGPARVVLHSRQIDGLIDRHDPDPDPLGSELHQLSVQVVPPLGSAEIVGRQVSRRPIPGDGLPSLGGLEGISGYYEAVTHSGITLAAIVGRLVADEVVDGRVDDLIQPFRPDRFTVASGSRGRS